METHREYIEAWKKRALIEDKEMEYWRKKALLKAKRAARFLAKKYKVKKVVLFGSLIRGIYRRDSDIDLAVAGLPKNLFLKVSVEVEELIKIPLDLKLIEEARGLFAKRIEEGITLYEKKS